MCEIVGQGDDRAIVRILTTDVLTQIPPPDFGCGCPQPMQGCYGGKGIINPWRLGPQSDLYQLVDQELRILLGSA